MTARKPEERFLVPGNQGCNTFRGCPGGRVVDLFRAREFIPNLLKTRGEILSANRGSKARLQSLNSIASNSCIIRYGNETTPIEIDTHLKREHPPPVRPRTSG